MTDYLERKKVIAALMEQVRAVAAQDSDPAAFLLELQCEIEAVPGAQVAFVQRDVNWLMDYGYVDEEAGHDLADLQSALVSASTDFEEGSASQDHITYDMQEVLSERGLAPLDDETPILG